MTFLFFFFYCKHRYHPTTKKSTFFKADRHNYKIDEKITSKKRKQCTKK